MELKEVLKNAKERLKGSCNICKECNGVYCAGKVPGMGGAGTGEAFKRSYDALKNIKLNLKTIHDAKDPNLETNFLGVNLKLPLISAPVTGSKVNFGGYLTEAEYVNSVLKGSLKAGTIAMIGDSGDPSFYEDGLKAIKDKNGIAIIKPRENDEIIKRIKMAEKVNALAVGIDLDGAGLVTMRLFNQYVGPKTKEDLIEIINSTKLPVILKGIMSVEEALIAKEVGAKAIVVSNHGGRVLNHTKAPCEVLPKIKKALEDEDIIIIADGNVREGCDILKYLALGADFVLAARPIIWGAVGGQDKGVSLIIDNMRNELYKSMILTGCKNLKSINSSVIS